MKKKDVIERLKEAKVEFDKSKSAKQLIEEFPQIFAPAEATPAEEKAEESVAAPVSTVLTEVPNELQGETCDDALFLQGKADPTDEACRDCKALDACLAQQAALTGAKTAPKKTGSRAAKSSESKLFIQNMIDAGKYTRQQIMDAYMAAYPSHQKSTVGTYLSDSKNPKYKPFPWLATVDKKNKVFSFIKEEDADEKAA